MAENYSQHPAVDIFIYPRQTYVLYMVDKRCLGIGLWNIMPFIYLSWAWFNLWGNNVIYKTSSRIGQETYSHIKRTFSHDRHLIYYQTTYPENMLILTTLIDIAHCKGVFSKELTITIYILSSTMHYPYASTKTLTKYFSLGIPIYFYMDKWFIIHYTLVYQ